MTGFINFLFIIEEYTLVLMVIGVLFMWHFPKRRYFYVRLLVPCTYIIIFCEKMTPYLPWYNYSNFFNIPWMQFLGIKWNFLIVFILFIFILFFLYKTTFTNVLIYESVSYVTQNLGNCIYRMIRIAAFNNEKNLGYYLTSFFIIIISVIIVYFVLIKHFIKKGDVEIENKFVFVFSIISIFIICVFSS